MSQEFPRTTTAYIHAQEIWDGHFQFTAFGCDMSSLGYILLDTVEVPIPDVTIEQIQGKYVVLLRKKMDEVAAEADAKIEQLRETVARLESITYTPAKE